MLRRSWAAALLGFGASGLLIQSAAASLGAVLPAAVAALSALAGALVFARGFSRAGGGS